MKRKWHSWKGVKHIGYHWWCPKDKSCFFIVYVMRSNYNVYCAIGDQYRSDITQEVKKIGGKWSYIKPPSLKEMRC